MSSLSIQAIEQMPVPSGPDGSNPSIFIRPVGLGEQDVAVSSEHLTKKYGNEKAVADLSFSVQAGRLFGFLGPNGAGKSTTIGCLTGLLDPTGGTIRLLGERFTSDSSDLKRRIGVLPEELALFEQLYAHEFLAFNARMYGLEEAEVRRRVEELLCVMDLASALKKPLAEYSTGMRKRVAFAAAVIHSPEILFLDEPFVNLDPGTVAMMKKWLRQFVAGGRTVFMTSHVLETVERLCDEVAIIRSGRLAWQGVITDQDGPKALFCDGILFGSLEELFLYIVGEQNGHLDWL